MRPIKALLSRSIQVLPKNPAFHPLLRIFMTMK
jgi:hypothetical protein